MNKGYDDVPAFSSSVLNAEKTGMAVLARFGHGACAFYSF